MRPGFTSTLIISILSLLPIGFFACTSSPVAGGATDTETGGIIVGMVLDSSGNGISGVSVSLIPASYNPLADGSLPDSLTVTTDEEGKYTFTVTNTDRYNISALRASDRSCFLHIGIIPGVDRIVRDTGILARAGYLMVQLPDTVDTSSGYLYFEGTRIARELKTMISFGNGYCNVVFDALPAATMPPLIYAHRDVGGAKVTVAPSIKIAESDSVVLETTAGSIKPLWRFSLLVGVKNVVSQHFGGTSQMASLIDNQLAAATKKLNATQKFSGVFLFTADSIYEYSGTIANEDAKPLYRFDYRLFYDNIDQAVAIHEIIRSRYVFLWNTQPDSLFGSVCNKWLVNLLGDLRGAFIIPMALVDATKNAVNYTAFTAIPSIMNNPEIYTSWDDYSVSVINYNAGNVGSERDIVKTAFPDTMGIMVTTASGSAVPGAQIQVFGSVLDTRAVKDSTLVTGLTDDNGRFVFPSNPFMANATGSSVYGTLLIITIASGDTTSTWLPLYEAGNAYFKNSTASFYKEVIF